MMKLKITNWINRDKYLLSLPKYGTINGYHPKAINVAETFLSGTIKTERSGGRHIRLLRNRCRTFRIRWE